MSGASWEMCVYVCEVIRASVQQCVCMNLCMYMYVCLRVHEDIFYKRTRGGKWGCFCRVRTIEGREMTALLETEHILDNDAVF